MVPEFVAGIGGSKWVQAQPAGLPNVPPFPYPFTAPSMTPLMKYFWMKG